MRGVTIDVTMDRREVEALALELERLAESCGLTVAVQIEAVTSKQTPRRVGGTP